MKLFASTDPRVSDLAEQARSLGYALVPLAEVADLEERVEAVADGEERGREFAPLVRSLGYLAGRALPMANQRIAELTNRCSELETEFTAFAMLMLLGEPIPDTFETEDS
jgi:hypothetical protein